MSSNRVGFRQFLNSSSGQTIRAILDTNVLIANYDEIHSQHEIVRNFLENLDASCNVEFFTTVTTKSEFLDYSRRRFLTEGLLDLVDEYEDSVKVSPSAKAAINGIKGRRNSRRNAENARCQKDETRDFDISVGYFSDSEIKEIKKSFRARDVEKEAGWLKICKTFLENRLQDDEAILEQFCTYLSPHDENQKDIFASEVNWKQATVFSEKTGLGYSDAMILNMIISSNIPYLITMDFDVGYAASVSARDKTIVIPDKMLKTYKKPLKSI